MHKIKSALANHSILLVLLGLVMLFSLLTLEKQNLTGEEAGQALALVVKENNPEGPVWLVCSQSLDDEALIRGFEERLSGQYDIQVINETPPMTRKAIESAIRDTSLPAMIVTSARAGNWLLFQDFSQHFPNADIPVFQLQPVVGINFLKTENLLNVADQIAVIAIMAIGMTMVIITGGIDLSVGSLVALAAVLMTQLIRDYFGAEAASTFDMWIAAGITLLICALIGLVSGTISTYFNTPSFIVTLSMMLVASGIAYTLSKGNSIYQVPDNFIWLGRGRMIGVPVSVWIMLVLYVIAHFVMTKMVFGRYVYAIGGNFTAARLSGVPIRKIIIIVFTISGMLAGLGGIILASQLNSGSPTYGLTYELYVIAAVVIGGTSLMGGEGTIWKTLIGAFVIGVIQNGMNLIGIESYTQKIILGALILVALIIERFRKRDE